MESGAAKHRFEREPPTDPSSHVWLKLVYLGVSEDVDISNVGIERMEKQH